LLTAWGGAGDGFCRSGQHLYINHLAASEQIVNANQSIGRECGGPAPPFDERCGKGYPFPVSIERQTQKLYHKEPHCMGQFAQADDALTLEDQIKTLGDAELLDFWEETQQLVKLMNPGDAATDERLHPEYERLILQELQVRSGRGELRS
jgi:hypothetical protein